MKIGLQSTPPAGCGALVKCGLAAVALLGSTLPLTAQAETDDTAPMKPVVVAPVTPAEVEGLLGGVPRITLQLKDTPLAEVLAQLNLQGNIELQFDMRYRPVDLKQLVSFEVQDAPLWEAVQTLENQTGSQVVLIENGVIFHGTNHRENLAPQSVRGPLYFLNPGMIVREAKATRVFATDEVTAHEKFSLTGLLVVDPRLHCISGSTVRVEEAIDDKGGSLLGDAGEFHGSSGSMGARNYLGFKVDFKSRPDMGRRILRLKGVASTLFAAKSETWEITDPRNAAGATKTVSTNLGDMTYKLDAVLKLGDTLRFSFVITGPVLGVFDNQPAPSLGTIIAACDANGKVMNIGGGGYSGSSARRRDAGIDFNPNDPAGIPAKLVLTLPLDIKRLEMPFELKDLPLPPVEPTTAVPAAAKQPDATPSLSVEEALQRAGGVPLVTLHFKATNAAEVVAELSRQSGIEVAFSRDPERMGTIPTISVDVEQQPFWTALRAILAACKLRFTYAVNARSIELVADTLGAGGLGQWQGPVGASGLVRVMATRFEREQHAQVTFAAQGSSTSQTLRLSCDVALPPQLAGLPLTNSVRIDEALDENGNSLRPTPQMESMSAMPSYYSADLKFVQDILLTHREDSRWLAQLKGAFRLDAATRRETWEIADCLKTQKETKKINVTYGDKTYEQTYTLDNFVVNDDEFRFTMHIVSQPRLPTPPQDARFMRVLALPQFFRSHVQLRDADGQLFPMVDVRIMGSDAEAPIVIRIPRRIHARNLGTPDRLALELPTEIQPVEIPFEFKDVPLP